jgi:hypothetical protein
MPWGIPFCSCMSINHTQVLSCKQPPVHILFLLLVSVRFGRSTYIYHPFYAPLCNPMTIVAVFIARPAFSGACMRLESHDECFCTGPFLSVWPVVDATYPRSSSSNQHREFQKSHRTLMLGIFFFPFYFWGNMHAFYMVLPKK